MKSLVVFSCLLAAAFAKPGHLLGAHTVYASVVPGAPIGIDGRVVDTAEVAHAKAAHAAAHVNEKLALNQEALRSADYLAAAPVVHAAALPVVHAAPVVHSAPILHAAPVLHSAPVLHAAAPVVHSAAALSTTVEQSSLSISHPSAVAYHSVAPVASHATILAAPAIASIPVVHQASTVLGHDGRPLDTPEVALAKAAHAAAHNNEKLIHAHEASKHSLWA